VDIIPENHGFVYLFMAKLQYGRTPSRENGTINPKNVCDEEQWLLTDSGSANYQKVASVSLVDDVKSR